MPGIPLVTRETMYSIVGSSLFCLISALWSATIDLSHCTGELIVYLPGTWLSFPYNEDRKCAFGPTFSQVR